MQWEWVNVVNSGNEYEMIVWKSPHTHADFAIASFKQNGKLERMPYLRLDKGGRGGRVVICHGRHYYMPTSPPHKMRETYEIKCRIRFKDFPAVYQFIGESIYWYIISSLHHCIVIMSVAFKFFDFWFHYVCIVVSQSSRAESLSHKEFSRTLLTFLYDN